MTKKYYQLDQNNADNADLYIFGDICSWPYKDLGEVSGYSIVKDLQAVEAKAITVHINSYGGDVAEGLAIYNVLKNSGKDITTICDGFACSAASVVFMAGSKRVMNAASLLMIHNAWTWATGNAEELRKVADDIETITQASVAAYKAVATIPEDEIKELMDAETWILPKTAVEYGFATEIAEAETGGVQQSAFGLISQALTTPRAKLQAGLALDLSEETLDAVAERIASKLNTPKPTANGWDKFFK